MAFARIVSLLQKCDSAQPVFPVTELFNEGWLLRLILDWFSQQPHKPHPLAFTAKSLWFSEARLPSQFLARYRGDELAESWTHADGVIGHIEVGGSRKTDTSLLPGATQLVATEAKLFSKLSPGVTNARFFNQAARYVACIAEMLNIAQRPASDFSDLGFYVLAPVEQIDAGAFTPEMNPTQILEKVRQRVEQYGGEKDRWFQECFLPTLERIDIECLSWERIIEHINGEDSSFGVEITDYYRRCREYNRQKKQ